MLKPIGKHIYIRSKSTQDTQAGVGVRGGQIDAQSQILGDNNS